MAINFTKIVAPLIDQAFWFYHKFKISWWKNIQIWEKIVYLTKLSVFKKFRSQSSHFKFWIQNLPGDMAKQGVFVLDLSTFALWHKLL